MKNIMAMRNRKWRGMVAIVLKECYVFPEHVGVMKNELPFQ